MQKSLLTVRNRSDSPITPKGKKNRTRLRELKGASPPTPDLFEERKEEECKTPVNKKKNCDRFHSFSPPQEAASPGFLSSQADCGVVWHYGGVPTTRKAKTQFVRPFSKADDEIPKCSPTSSKKLNRERKPKGFDKFRLGLRALYDDKVNDGQKSEQNATKDSMDSDTLDFNGSSDSDNCEIITKSLPNIDKVCTNLSNSFMELDPTSELDNSIRKVKSTHNFDTKNDLLNLEESDEDFDAMLIMATQQAEQEVVHKREFPATPKRRRSSAGCVVPTELSFDDSINEILCSVPIDSIVSKAYENISKAKQTPSLRHSSMPVSPQVLKPNANNKTNVLNRHISLPPNQDQKNVEQSKMINNYNKSTESVNSTISSTSSASPHRMCTKEEIERKRLAAKAKFEERKRRLQLERQKSKK